MPRTKSEDAAIGRGVSLGVGDRKAYDRLASTYPVGTGFSQIMRDLLHKAVASIDEGPPSDPVAEPNRGRPHLRDDFEFASRTAPPPSDPNGAVYGLLLDEPGVTDLFDKLSTVIPGEPAGVLHELIRREAKRSLCPCGGVYVKSPTKASNRRHVCDQCGKSVAR